MLLSELMANATPKADYEGFITNDDYVLALDCGETPATDFTNAGSFAVVQMGVSGLDSNLNAITQDKVFIRAGQSTTKTGNQRSFSVSGDRYKGDPFQDFVFKHNIKYGRGQSVVRKYVYFNILTGEGEAGEVCIIVNSDGSGEAGNSAEIDVELKKNGSEPIEYTWKATA